MSLIYLVQDGGESVRRRPMLPSGTFLEVWPDLHAGGAAWVTEHARALLGSVGDPLPVLLTIDAARVAIYYGPTLSAVDALPAEDSLRSRVLSAHGIAVALVTSHPAADIASSPGPEDVVFVLRRPRGTVAHRWRLFRTRTEAKMFMREFSAGDPGAQAWATGLPVPDWTALLEGADTEGGGGVS